MKFLFIEPFYGGSHKAFCDGLAEHSKHEIEILKLPAQNFKWRIRGSAYFFFRACENIYDYDGIIVSDMINLCEFKSFFKKKLPPVLFYFHENQIDYPLANNEKIDYHFVFSNINSALCADLIYFNSFSHMNNFLKSVKQILKRMPEDYDLTWITGEIEKRGRVLYPGCDFKYFKKTEQKKNKILHILWNHRWDYDKQPEVFFRLLRHLKYQNLLFRVFILGEKGEKPNSFFIEGKKEFRHEIAYFGYVKNKKDYAEILKKGDIVVSTSIQENFGYSVIEAVKAQCVPVLPERLSYPEIIPQEFHPKVLYRNYKELLGKVISYIEKPESIYNENFHRLFMHMDKYSWETLIKKYDDALEKLSYLA